MSERIWTASLPEVFDVARQIGSTLGDHAILFLRGELAAGKTTLVKAFATLKGCGTPVTSPTFSIQQIYDCGIYHYDLYQCPTQKFLTMGLTESLEEPGWHLIEWGDETLENLLKAHGFDVTVLTIETTPVGRRYRMVQDA